MCRKSAPLKAFRDFCKISATTARHAPKAGALPTAPHPEIYDNEELYTAPLICLEMIESKIKPLCNIKKIIASRCLLEIFCVAAAADRLAAPAPGGASASRPTAPHPVAWRFIITEFRGFVNCWVNGIWSYRESTLLTRQPQAIGHTGPEFGL